jgi:hypothetical protein
MIRMITVVDVAPGHEAELEQEWQSLRQAAREYAGFRGASLLRDSSEPSHYLVLSEWDGHDDLAAAMRGLGWLKRGLMAGPTAVYDEVVDSVPSTIEADGAETSV